LRKWARQWSHRPFSRTHPEPPEMDINRVFLEVSWKMLNNKVVELKILNRIGLFLGYFGQVLKFRKFRGQKWNIKMRFSREKKLNY
jgi:hypothetical protein